MRRASGRLVAPDRRMSSWVMTKMAAAASATFCVLFETDVTCTFIRSSRLMLVTSGTFCGFAGPSAHTLATWHTVRTPSKATRPARAIEPMFCLRIDNISKSPSRKWPVKLAWDPRFGAFLYSAIFALTW